MVGAGAPGAIDLDKALGGWRELSWFLDDGDLDDAAAGAAAGGAGGLLRSWRLGNRPNLKQMHGEACAQRVADDAVEQHLKDEARGARRLTGGVRPEAATCSRRPATTGPRWPTGSPAGACAAGMVWATREGRQAARAVDGRLMGRPGLPRSPPARRNPWTGGDDPRAFSRCEIGSRG